MKLVDKVALVTGAGKGLGRTVALALAGEGAAVVVTDLDAEAANGVAKEIKDKNGGSLSSPANVGDRGEAQKLVDAAIKEMGKIDILVNCTGIVRQAPLTAISAEDWNEVLKMNLKSAFLCTQLVAPGMMDKKTGSIINLVPTEGWSNDSTASYCAARAGIAGLTRANAKEMSRYNVRVNAVFPPTTKQTADDLWRVYLSRIALGCLAEPDDIAPVIVFLASDDSKYLSGQIIGVEWY